MDTIINEFSPSRGSFSMKKTFSRVLVALMAVFMVLAMSGCANSKTDLMDFLLNGWDGVYVEKEAKEIEWPDPTKRTHEIREDHKVTSVNHKVESKSASSSADNKLADTNAPSTFH